MKEKLRYINTLISQKAYFSETLLPKIGSLIVMTNPAFQLKRNDRYNADSITLHTYVKIASKTMTTLQLPDSCLYICSLIEQLEKCFMKVSDLCAYKVIAIDDKSMYGQCLDCSEPYSYCIGTGQCE